MSVPIVTFFNNKGGVGKTSLVYHTAWMLSELGRRVLAVDLDPQANLTAAFLDEEKLVELWEGSDDERPDTDTARTVYRAVQPLLEVGDLKPVTPVPISSRLALVPGDLALAGFEDELATQWGKALGETELYRAFRILSAFWAIAQDAASAHGAELVLFDVGPNLGALNRAALLATDHVVVPLGGDLFSIQGLRNLGPTLARWRSGWKTRRDNWKSPTLKLPGGAMEPVGYVVQQHEVRLSRPVKAYTRWLDRIPQEYRTAMLDSPAPAPPVTVDPECLAMVKHFRSLVPMGQEARRPVFLLRAADGAVGSHAAAVQRAYADFSAFSKKLLGLVGLPPETQQKLFDE
jgi:cellulose biosynthesis protein BcsQ